MGDQGKDFLFNHLRMSCEGLQRATTDPILLSAMVEISDMITRALVRKGKVLIAGTGGSAADAQHIAGEFLSRLNFDRHPLPAVALTTDTSVLTAIGDDYGFEQVFERQVCGA
jgi:D-sedoheptulose 7-phosphate isomerase